MDSKLDYRPDIDGLRAVAVLSVLFFHLGLKPFSGGYVGVDVFFVISGYLITSIIVREMRAGEFSFVKFYERRIRRIFPSLFVVLAATLIVGAFVYSAADFKAISASAISVTFFFSNLRFWSQAGYFEGPSTLQPLLHAWSLSVEEQFYIFFPAVMFAIARWFRSRFTLVLALLLALSFASGVFVMARDSSAAFYFMHLRAWELLTGSLLALRVLPTRLGRGLRNGFSFAGFATILASVFLFTESTIFPGFSALLPVAGSALIIYGGMEGDSLVGRVLSLPPLVFVGKISYSLYLWHWPVVVIGKYYLIRQPTTIDLVAWTALIFLLSVLSWRWIETPFRARSFLPSPRIFQFAAATMAVIFAACLTIYLTRGLPQRFPADQVVELGWSDPELLRWKDCMIYRRNGIPDAIELCKLGAQARTAEFLLWGDSHAGYLLPGLDSVSSAADAAVEFSVVTGCPPLIGIDRMDGMNGSCYRYNQMMIEYVQARPQLHTIVLSARWANTATGQYYKTEAGPPFTLVDLLESRPGGNATLFELGLERTVATLVALGRNVIIVAPIPEVGYHVPSAYSIADRTARDVNILIAPTPREYLDRNREVFSAFEAIARKYPITIIAPSSILCDDQRCRVFAEGRLLYMDDDHLSAFGSHFISGIFIPMFAGKSP